MQLLVQLCKRKTRINLMFMRVLLVEARGIEPLSENSFVWLSSSEAYLLHSLTDPPTGRLADLVAHIHPVGRGTPHGTFTAKVTP